ncbi:MAG: S-methyl-5-thioribose-1-phosphate isomerase [Candidatus Bathyarchaeia archaeon]|nr:MAG: S-methyl-5-thioribose-1-phosphate isomerase [Candidatus Bathyarchaeota archaeon]
MQVRTIEWRDGKVFTVDQTKLPNETVTLKIKNCFEMAEAIKTMKIRGAPLLGAAAAFALALTAHNARGQSREKLLMELERAASIIMATRPTAVNLFWALDRILTKAKSFSGSAEKLAAFVVMEAQKIADEDVEANRLIGKHGAALIADGDVVLTHCNAGALATVGYGTALGVVRAAWEQGKKIRVFATETRPKLQGARLTTYELKRDGIPVTLITDNMVGYVMYKRLVNKVIVGADRIVRDAVINKIGTFTIAVVAKEQNIPFYVAAPKSTFDLKHTSAKVVIEERNPEEVTHFGSQRIAAEGISVLNPAFDITPLKYVSAIICESGILYKEDFDKLKG